MVQEFDSAAGLDKVKKLIADLTQKEAERARISRECESLKVRLQLHSRSRFSWLTLIAPCT